MITFKEFLNEVADSKIKSKIMRKTKTEYEASATFDGKTIEFGAAAIPGFDDEDDPFNPNADGSSAGSRAWEVWFEENGSVDMTGTGREFRTAAAVVQMLGAFIKRYEPTMLTFTAQKDEQGKENRSRVYARLMNRHFKDWKITKNDEHQDQAEVTMVRG